MGDESNSKIEVKNLIKQTLESTIFILYIFMPQIIDLNTYLFFIWSAVLGIWVGITFNEKWKIKSK